MNPKEKAENLIEKFIPNTKIWNDETGWVDCVESAKRCGLIVVDEIQKLPNMEYDNNKDESQYDYWQDVKQELLKIK